jgi:transcriptional regulator with XRE-family HTH domain
MEGFGERLKLLRENKELSQDYVATQIDVSRATYSHFENNRNEPGLETLVKLSKFYSVSVDYLLGRYKE